MAELDPILTAIAAHRAAEQAYDGLPSGATDQDRNAAYDVWWDSYVGLFTTRPASLAGVVALLERLVEPTGGGELVADLMIGNWSGDPIEGQPGGGDFLRMLAEAVRKIGGAPPPDQVASLVNLLRALATGTDHIANKHDVIFTAAAGALETQADEIERLRAEITRLRSQACQNCGHREVLG